MRYHDCNVLVLAAARVKFSALCEHGGKAGLRVSLEFGMFTEVRTICEAVAIATAVSDPAAAILVDPIHLDRSGGRPEDVALIPRELLSYAQLCDAPERMFDVSDFDAVIRDAVDERRQLGEGILPVAETIAALPPGIPFSIELRSLELRTRFPDPVERARAVLLATQGYFSR